MSVFHSPNEDELPALAPTSARGAPSSAMNASLNPDFHMGAQRLSAGATRKSFAQVSRSSGGRVAGIRRGIKVARRDSSDDDSTNSGSSNDERLPPRRSNTFSGEGGERSAVGGRRGTVTFRAAANDDDEADDVVFLGEMSCWQRWTTPQKRAASMAHSALFVFSPTNPLRCIIFNITHTKVFEGLVLLHILVNSIFLALNNPLEDDPQWQVVGDYYFIAAFTVEMLMRVVANGLFLHNGSYCRNRWNILDGLIVLLSYMGLVPGMGNFTALRTIRVLRPLRSMNAIGGLKVIVIGLMHSVSGLVHVITLLLFAFTIFGILGVQLWMGLYRMRCVDLATNTTLDDRYCNKEATIGESSFGRNCPLGQECRAVGNGYANVMNFDSVPQAFLVLFSLMTFENWPDHLLIVYDTWGQIGFIYFFLFIVFCAYFVPNLALAVINEKFVEAHDRILAEQEEALEEAERRELAEAHEVALLQQQRIAQSTAANPLGAQDIIITHYDALDESEEAAPRSIWDAPVLQRLLAVRQWMFKVIEGYERPQTVDGLNSNPALTPFGYFIFACIILNTLVLASQFHLQPDWLDDLQTIANRVLTYIFLAELVVKLFAMGIRFYVADFFNVVDGVTTVASVIEQIIAGSSVATVFRTFRLLRILKLLRNLQSVRKILRVLISAMKDTGFLSLIVLLYLFMAALVGMQLFGASIESAGTAEEPVRANFRNFFRSVLTVFQVLTRDGWIDVMLNATKSTSPAAVLYFVGLVLIGDFLILNLFLAILIGAFEEDDITEMLIEEGEIAEGDVRSPGPDKIQPPPEIKRPDSVISRSTSFHASHLKKKHALTSRDGGADIGVGFAKINLKPSDIIYLNAPMARIIHRAKELSQRKQAVAALQRLNVEGRELSRADIAASMALEIPSLRIDQIPEADSHEPSDASGSETASQFSDQRSRASHKPAVQRPSRGSSPASRLSFFGDRFVRGTMKKKEEEDVGISFCSECEQLRLPTLPSAPLVPQKTTQELHRRMCSTMAVRASKQKIADSLIDFVTNQSRMGERPTMEKLSILLGQAWSCGLLLNFTPETLMASNWDQCLAALNEDMSVLSLRVGEEVVGRSLVAYVAASVPRDTVTNGGDALFLLGPRNTFRLLCTDIINNPWFDRFILLIILLSSVALAVDNPREPKDSDLRVALNIFDILFTAIFVGEMTVKVFALGFVLHKGSYLRDPWNWLDFAIVIISVASFALSELNFSYLKVLRIFRALRPLRLITKNRGLQMVVLTLFRSIKGIINVAIISGLNYVIFAVLGVQLFGGKFYRCTDAAVTLRVNCTGTYVNAQNVTQTRYWKNAPRNFDNIFESLLTLFEVSVMEWWTDVLWDSIDAASYDRAPEQDYNVAYGLFYIVFIVIASFFLLNMFVGVMISNFNSVKIQLDGMALLTDEQRMWSEAQRILLNFKPQPLLHASGSRISLILHPIVSHPVFDIAVLACVILNTLALATDHYSISPELDFAITTINDIFSGVFIIEAAVKLLALEKRYFLDSWNKFDFFLVLLSIINFGLRGASAINVNVLQVVRVFRILRVLRLVKQAKRVRILLSSLWYSLPSLANIGGLMMLLFFLYTVMGVQVFFNIRSGSKIDNEYTNFFNFWNGIQLLFRFMTVTDWNEAMHDCMVQAPYCNDSADSESDNTCGTLAAPLYFISFVILTSFILTNLLVAIILDNFNTTTHMERSQIQMTDVHRFVDVWARYDRDATMTIPTHCFPLLLARLRPPLGISHMKSHLELLRLCQQYNIPEHAGRMHFIETLIPLARFTLGVEMTRREEREQEEAWRDMLPEVRQLPLIRLHGFVPATVDVFFAAVFIQAAYRRRRACRLAEERRRAKKEDAANFLRRQSVAESRVQGPHREKGHKGRSGALETFEQSLMTAVQHRLSATPLPELKSPRDGDSSNGASGRKRAHFFNGVAAAEEPSRGLGLLEANGNDVVCRMRTSEVEDEAGVLGPPIASRPLSVSPALSMDEPPEAARFVMQSPHCPESSIGSRSQSLRAARCGSTSPR